MVAVAKGFSLLSISIGFAAHPASYSMDTMVSEPRGKVSMAFS
jgi:hypothetical protein